MDQKEQINVYDISSDGSMQIEELFEIMAEKTQDSPKLEDKEQLTPTLQMEHIPMEQFPTELFPKKNIPAANYASFGKTNLVTFGEIKSSPLLLDELIVSSSSAARNLNLSDFDSLLTEDLKIYPVSLSDLKVKPKQSKATRKFVPEDQKDEKYYEFRRKNTAAVRRSRDAAYEKEKRLKIRLAFLEQEDERLQTENNLLRKIIENKDAELEKLKTLQHYHYQH